MQPQNTTNVPMTLFSPFNTENCLKNGLYVRSDKITKKQRGLNKQLHPTNKRSNTQHGQLQFLDNVKSDVIIQQQNG